MDHPEIRIATVDDLPQIEACARAAYRKYIERMGRPPAPMLADFSRQIGQGIVHVLTSNGELAGYVVFYPMGDYIHLENIAVEPARAGRGLGRIMIEFVEAEAGRLGFPGVELYTNEQMTENLDMYLALGYQEVARRNEEGFDRVYFRKLLGETE